jgi:biotin carboxyl carrier protein
VKTIEGEEFTVLIETQSNSNNIKIGKSEYKVEALNKGNRDNEYILKINDKIVKILLIDDKTVFIDNDVLQIENIKELFIDREIKGLEEITYGGGEIKSPIQGRIASIRVKEGDAVNKGQPLLSIEAMKSETVISSPISGIVQKILVKVGQGVKKGDVLIIIK